MLLGIPKRTYLAVFLTTLSPNRPFASNSFFRPKTIFKEAIIKTNSATIAFFSPFFLLLTLSFSFVTMILELLGLKKRAFSRYSRKWLQVSLFWFSKSRLNVYKECCQSVKVCHLHVADGVSGHLVSMLLISRDHCFQRILPICQSVSFACGRRGFRPFGISAAPFAGLSSRIFDNVIAK